MIDDILYTEQFLVFEVPVDTAAGYNDSGVIEGVSYDGNNYFFTQGGGESISIFIN
jgi:hypothetical protein